MIATRRVAAPTDILIVGAGIGGLTLGLLLGGQGYRVTILDERTGRDPLYRPELLQPAGLEVLDALGVLDRLVSLGAVRCEVFDFLATSGRRLCRVDYRLLGHRFSHALIALPHLTQAALLEKLSGCPTVQVRRGCSLSWLARSQAGLSHATFWERGEFMHLTARVVIGADGRLSRVRKAAGIETTRKSYRDAFVTLMARRPVGFADTVRYYVGRRQILGMFPATPEELCLLYMVPAEGRDALKARGLSALKAEISALDAEAASVVSEVMTWDRVAYMDCQTLQADSWVGDGVALLGDAAHTCHPHVAQGGTQAMLDAMALASVLRRCLEDGDCSAARLSAYETSRRPAVERLQRIAHEYARIWNSGNPLLAWLRDRMFSEIGRRPRLLAKVMETEAGLRTSPLTIPERIQALGVFS